MSNSLLLFASTFVCVFALGLQSLNVNQGHYGAAASTSIAISTGNIFLFKYMPDSGLLEWSGYYFGGVTGIVASMWFHRRVKAWWKARRPAPAVDEHAADIYPACLECGNAAGKSCPRLVCDRFVDATLH